MTDKVQKIREKVVEMVNSINPFIPDEDGKNSDYEAGKLDAATRILQIMDSLEEPVSEDLEKACEKYADERLKIIRPDIYDSSYSRSTKMTLDLFEGYELETAFEEGANWQKKQMMKNATNVTVHIDAGGYPYIPEIELYDYDKDVPLAKEGDKYKVVLIKED